MFAMTPRKLRVWCFYTNQLSMKSSGQTVGTEEAPKAPLPPSDVMRSNPADPIHFDVVRESLRALNAYAICPHVIQWTSD